MTEQIQNEINKILDHLNEYSLLINCHMVDYFSKKLYEKCLPLSIIEEIMANGYDYSLNTIFNQGNKRCGINKFITDCNDLSLCGNRRICLSFDELQAKFVTLKSGNVKGLKLDVFMNRKKSYEVEKLSTIATCLKEIGNTTHVIDIGDGKGYLSSLLALHYNIPVLGVDSSKINTISANKRLKKLSKNVPSISTEKTITDHEKHLYKQITKFVTQDTNFKELVDEVFKEKSDGLSLVGLHTCGNLATSSIRIFTGNKHVKTICNVSCCYNLLSEEDHLQKSGFPLSKFLKLNNYKLGERARMLACQSVDRILFKRELPNKKLFYRAVFEVILDKYFPNLECRVIGRFKKDPTSFVDYARKSAKRLGITFTLTDGEIEHFETIYKTREKELYCFNLLRCIIAPVIEALILLDRLLFLKECHIENSYLVKLFDPVISPRCYGLIAFKNL